ncbi:MAG TPA: hypothetical protein DCX53_00650 [Anaerolineae bacterium]|nr:hypothetical protein [Anaerolineae bacterium]
MADISAAFFILLIIGVAFPAMLTAWWLLFPNLIERARSRVEKTPAQTFWFGLMVLVALTVPIIILFALPFGPAKSLGWILLGFSIAVSSIGSAGIAAHIGTRLTRQSNFSPLSAFVRGAVILELAAFFPVIGWLFVWIPLLITAFGATAFALLKWTPREKTQTSPASSSSVQVNSSTSNI